MMPQTTSYPNPSADFSGAGAPKKKGLTGKLGKIFALASLAGACAVYTGAYQIGSDVYHNWQDPQAASWQAPSSADILKVKDGHMPWEAEGIVTAGTLAAGFTAIALGRKNRRSQAAAFYGSGDSYRGGSYRSDDGFWTGYWIGSSGRGSSSSGGGGNSDDGAAIVAVAAIGALAVVAAGTGVVTYKALRANFGSP